MTYGWKYNRVSEVKGIPFDCNFYNRLVQGNVSPPTFAKIRIYLVPTHFIPVPDTHAHALNTKKQNAINQKTPRKP
jgi:hypothetical protein